MIRLEEFMNRNVTYNALYNISLEFGRPIGRWNYLKEVVKDEIYYFNNHNIFSYQVYGVMINNTPYMVVDVVLFPQTIDIQKFLENHPEFKLKI